MKKGTQENYLLDKDFYSKQKSKSVEVKTTNVNVLLNRVKTNQKNESRKKLYFSAAASSALVLFVLIIF